MNLSSEKLRFGYTQNWFDAGLLNEKDFKAQIERQKVDGDTNYEHYRYAAFNSWLNKKKEVTDKELFDFMEVAFADPDKAMAGGAVANLLEKLWLTEDQFNGVASKFQRFGLWTLKRIERAKNERMKPNKIR